MRRIIIAVIAAGLLAMGCTSTAGKEDGPVGKRHEKPRQVWVSSDGYPNIEAYCIGENGAYVNTREAGNVVITPSDPNCSENGILRD